MGQKVHPLGIRLGFTKTWDAKWFSKKNVPDLIQEDLGIRGFVKKRLFSAGIGKLLIERAGNAVRVNIHAARPGLIIGKKGADIETLRMDLEQFTDSKVSINIVPIKKPELNALLVAEDIAQQLLKRGSYRRILKKSIARTMIGGAQGIKIKVSGRLSGAEIARTEWLKEGRIPLQTLRANIEYGFAESNTSFGKIGVKTWIFIEDDIEKRLKEKEAKMKELAKEEKPVQKEVAVENAETENTASIAKVEGEEKIEVKSEVVIEEKPVEKVEEKEKSAAGQEEKAAVEGPVENAGDTEESKDDKKVE